MIRFKAQEFGQALHQERHRRGGSNKPYPFGRFYPVAAVAEEAGVATSVHIHRIESGAIPNPTFITIMGLARWMGRTVDEFVEEEELVR